MDAMMSEDAATPPGLTCGTPLMGSMKLTWNDPLGTRASGIETGADYHLRPGSCVGGVNEHTQDIIAPQPARWLVDRYSPEVQALRVIFPLYNFMTPQKDEHIWENYLCRSCRKADFGMMLEDSPAETSHLAPPGSFSAIETTLIHIYDCAQQCA